MFLYSKYHYGYGEAPAAGVVARREPNDKSDDNSSNNDNDN